MRHITHDDDGTRRRAMGAMAAGLLAVAALLLPGAAGAQAKKEIVVGCALPLTGGMSAFARYFGDAYRLWEEEVNAKGGLLNAKVRMIIYDDKSDAPTSVALYHKLITVDKADLLVGGFATQIVLPVMPVAEKYKMLFIQGGANSHALITKGNYKYAVTTLTSDTRWSDPLWEWLGSIPGATRPKKVAFVPQVNPFLQGVVNAAIPKAAPLGIENVAVETYSSDAQDFTAMLQKFKAAGVDFLFGGNAYPAGLTFLRTIAELQYRPKLIYMIVGPTTDAWIKDLGPRTDYVFTSTPYYHTLKFAGNERFVKAMEAKYGYTPTREAGQAYTPLQVLEQAVQATKSLNQDTLRQYIGSHEFETVSGQMTFDSYGLGTSRIYLMQVQQGKRFLVYPAPAKGAEAVYPRP